jgi:endoglucanase
MRRVLSVLAVMGIGLMGAATAGLPASAHAGHQITVSDDAVNEGATASVTVSVSPATQNTAGFAGRKETITVGVSTIDGTAVAPDDYTTKAQTVTFAPGESTKTFTVVTAQDALSEGNETFSVRLSNPTFSCVRGFGGPCPSSGAITDDTGVVTIVDDEPPPPATPSPTPVPGSLLISDSPTATKATDCIHTVTLAPAPVSTVTVDFTATGSVNQLGNTSGSLTFVAGETTKTVTLDVIKQKKKKGLVTVTLSNAVGANIVDGTGTCAIKKKKKR